MGFIIANWYIFMLSFLVAYLLGSINTAVIVTKIFTKGGDIRMMGSGNAGFTNVLRSVGKVPAILTIVCDLLKSVVAVLIGGWIFAMLS
ncbi:MAG: glycerol-3-phosphate acyltransferase [Ruminococcus sp.]|nr:glycerol-3-phosphate acyltransferase [Ruminococcus sp.]